MRFPWLWMPFLGPIRVSTVLTGVVLVTVIIARRRRPLTAVVAVMAWLSSYEIAYQATGVVMHGWSVGYFLWMTAAVVGWVVLGAVAGIQPDRWLLSATAVVWLLWITTGFDSNSPTVAGSSGFPRDFRVSDEILNELTKTLLALAYLGGALRQSKGRTHPVRSIEIG